MMDNPTLKWLLVAAALLLAIAAAGGAVALRLQKRQQRVEARIDTVTSAYARIDAREEKRRVARRKAEAQPMLHQVGRVFGYDATRAEHYPVKWYFVIPVAFLLARLAAELMVNLIGWFAMALVPVAAVLVSRGFYKWCRNRRKRMLYMQFPDALAMIVRGVRVGIPVTESMRTVARESAEPTAEEFRRVADRVGLGVPMDEALYEMAERNELSEYRFFATAIGLQAQTGGGLSDTLENLADVIRKRVALRARGYALASEARSSIMILCALPIVTGIALSILNPDYIMQLFNNDMGKKVFASAVVSFSVGLGVMQFIVKKSLS